MESMDPARAVVVAALLAGCANPAPDKQHPGYVVSGRELFDQLGEKVTLRGTNKMNVFTDREGTSFAEIRKTGANSVRIVWATADDDFVPTAADLDAIIARALANQMIPMIELHDATGDWSRLPALVDYWTRPDIVAVLQHHESYLLVNIGNEIGNDQVTAAMFRADYGTAVRRMRDAGIHSPLVIDASDFGKDIDILMATAADLTAGDPDRNLLFSVHMYWGVHDGADAAYIADKLQAAVDAGVPLIVGEFAGYGAFAGVESSCGEQGRVDHVTILEQCDRHSIGWYAWEWGPGNVGGGDPACTVMDMTAASTFATLQPGWATEVATTSPFGIANTAITPRSILER